MTPSHKTSTPAAGSRTAPVVLYACVHNSGRSVAAKVLTERLGTGLVEVRSAGSEPGASINPDVAAVRGEMGVATDNETPKLLTREMVGEADVVVTMGCGETCPVFPAKRYVDWPVDDPAGQDRDTVRRIVLDIDQRVRALLAELGIELRSH
jgi:arsenate reductase